MSPHWKLCLWLCGLQTEKREIQSGISAAAADVDDISDYIGKGGISSKSDWNSLKVQFLSLCSSLCLQLGILQYRNRKKKRTRIASFGNLNSLLWRQFLRTFSPFYGLSVFHSFEMINASSLIMEHCIWTETIQLLWALPSDRAK